MRCAVMVGCQVSVHSSAGPPELCIWPTLKGKTEVGAENWGRNQKSHKNMDMIKKNSTQIWPDLCGILFNSFPNQPLLCDRYVY